MFEYQNEILDYLIVKLPITYLHKGFPQPGFKYTMYLGWDTIVLARKLWCRPIRHTSYCLGMTEIVLSSTLIVDREDNIDIVVFYLNTLKCLVMNLYGAK